MPQLTINLTPKLQERFNYYAASGNETPEELAIRLCAEYVEDCDDADRISAEIDSGKMKTYPLEEVMKRLELAD
ncbi:MAG: hypothetical protein IJ859_01685 [Synergistaceae bacterium]|nr:hypothetical protein [Synergistaceae bacterium]